MEVQDKLRENDPKLSKMIVPVSLAHVTVLVFHAEQEKIQAARDIISDTLKSNSIHSFHLKFEGLDSFNNSQILYAKPTEGKEKLKIMNAVLKKALKEGGFLCNEKPYNPHVTILKAQSSKFASVESFEAELKRSFGVEEVAGIQLCMVSPEREDDGFYQRAGQWNLLNGEQHTEGDSKVPLRDDDGSCCNVGAQNLEREIIA